MGREGGGSGEQIIGREVETRVSFQRERRLSDEGAATVQRKMNSRSFEVLACCLEVGSSQSEARLQCPSSLMQEFFCA